MTKDKRRQHERQDERQEKMQEKMKYKMRKRREDGDPKKIKMKCVVCVWLCGFDFSFFFLQNYQTNPGSNLIFPVTFCL